MLEEYIKKSNVLFLMDPKNTSIYFKIELLWSSIWNFSETYNHNKSLRDERNNEEIYHFTRFLIKI